MKRLAICLSLLAVPAFGQQQQHDPGVVAQSLQRQILEMSTARAVSDADASAQIASLQAQLAEAKKSCAAPADKKGP